MGGSFSKTSDSEAKLKSCEAKVVEAREALSFCVASGGSVPDKPNLMAELGGIIGPENKPSPPTTQSESVEDLIMASAVPVKMPKESAKDFRKRSPSPRARHTHSPKKDGASCPGKRKNSEKLPPSAKDFAVAISKPSRVFYVDTPEKYYTYQWEGIKQNGPKTTQEIMKSLRKAEIEFCKGEITLAKYLSNARSVGFSVKVSNL